MPTGPASSEASLPGLPMETVSLSLPGSSVYVCVYSDLFLLVRTVIIVELGLIQMTSFKRNYLVNIFSK
jgi:hypothetical protein